MKYIPPVQNVSFVMIKLLFFIHFIPINAQNEALTPTKIEAYYLKNNKKDIQSVSEGTVSNGKLLHAKLIPFQGSNFQYFDTTSYLKGRAYTNSQLEKTVLETYAAFETTIPKRTFFIMECSNKHGGKMYPHRTHQNGLSIDFMMPLQKSGTPYYNLDTIGASHYWLNFDDEGNYSKDTSVTIDFELVARHILMLDAKARSNGLKIAKVIIKTELKDELYQGEFGQQLKNSGIYLVKKLTPLINSLHDDHYHIDFVFL